MSILILMDHGNRTRNLHRILAETKLAVISSTEKYVNQPAGTHSDADAVFERVPDVRCLYGRPALPDFNTLTDEMFDLYSRDGVRDLDSLVPVYDFSVQSFSHKQVLDAPLKKREPFGLVGGQPMMWSESLTEIFAWRGTGKTLFSLALGMHLAAGKSMPGLEILSPRKVLYVEGELAASQLQERYKQLSAGLAIPEGGFELIAKSLQERNRGQAAVTIQTEAGRLAIEEVLERTGADVLFIDSIASLARINTNNEEQWIPLIEWFVDLRCRGICVVYLQQSGKSGEQRGHSVSEDRNDLAIKLTSTKTNPGGAAFDMTFTKQREGSLTPLRLKCTRGVWELGEVKRKAANKTAVAKGSKRERRILEALNGGESQRSVAARLKVSLREVSEISKLQKETTNNDTVNVQG